MRPAYPLRDPTLPAALPQRQLATLPPSPYNASDWTYVEGRNVWVYEPAGEPPVRPPEALPQGAEQGGQWTYHADREHWYYEPPVAALPTGTDGGESVVGERPYNARDWTYVEGRNVWVYEPAGEPPVRPPEALPQGAEQGGQWTYHADREHWYYEPPVADAGVEAAPAQPSGSADAATGETGADSDLTDTQQEVANHVAQFLAGGGVLTVAQRQRLVELGILEPGEDAATGETAADTGAGAAQVQQSGSADAATGETGADSDFTDTQQEVANHVAQFLAGGGVLTVAQRQRLVELGILEPGEDAEVRSQAPSGPSKNRHYHKRNTEHNPRRRSVE